MSLLGLTCLLPGCQSSLDREAPLPMAPSTVTLRPSPELVALLLAASGATTILPAWSEASQAHAPVPPPETGHSMPASEPGKIGAAIPHHAAVTRSMLVALDTRIQVILDNIWRTS